MGQPPEELQHLSGRGGVPPLPANPAHQLKKPLLLPRLAALPALTADGGGGASWIITLIAMMKEQRGRHSKDDCPPSSHGRGGGGIMYYRPTSS